MGTELGNLCSLLCIFILHVSILTHESPSPPLLTLGARHSHGCGRLYACSPPGGTKCPPFAVHVTVINTTTTTTSPCSRFGIRAYGHARQAAMAELSGSQPSGPTQSSTFNPGRPTPPQEGDLAARNAEEKFVYVMGRRVGQQRGQTMDYRCRYCLVDFCGAWTQSIRDHFQV